MMRRTLPMVLILLGIIIFLYPTINDRYESYKQQQILKQWQNTLGHIDAVASEPIGELVDMDTPFLTKENNNMILLRGSNLLSVEPSPTPLAITGGPIEGILAIDKINLKLPILTDATAKNLKLSVASIAHTGKVGAVGNYAIAGHRNLTYGKNFNRLDEVDVGDWIEVDTGSLQYWYQVQDKQYVLPEDVWVLEGNGKDREITLITCDPMENPTHRIVVKGKLLEHKE
ncbi:class D sortase [Paenibacillus sp. Root444D2]|uniref:class D sortase n=1 Tax=Paenibacillus sp. Root444D2 TaxID=1736538 RepID=UPI000709FB49|nr:class D sortase [Paenibacillus sp. Root444D2]KQX46966.1 sortase [Paenibacillus sp. Root444D2]